MMNRLRKAFSIVDRKPSLHQQKSNTDLSSIRSSIMTPSRPRSVQIDHDMIESHIMAPPPLKQSNFKDDNMLVFAQKKEEEEESNKYLQLGLKYHEKGELEKATYYWRLSSQHGSPLGLFFYGIALRHGWGCKKDPIKAVKYLQSAAESAVYELQTNVAQSAMVAKSELVLAIYELGVCFRHGWGVPKNLETAAYYFQIASNLGDPDAQNDLGFCYMHGIGVKKDLYLAAKYYRLAEKQGQGIIGSMQALLEGMHLNKLTFENDANWDYIALFEQIPTTLSLQESYPIEYLEPLKSLWKDKGIQETFSKGHTFAFNENIYYFFDELDRIFQPGFIPSDADIIHCRIKTTGIVETKFRNGSVTYKMLDVGGQRSERKKWIHCFDNVAAILFVVALSGYDSCLVEDKYSNQMYEAFMLFESICNSKWFINTSIILFLNKNDLFKKKLLKSNVKDYFPDYRGSPTDNNQAKEYFKSRFLCLNANHQKQIYVHFTVATDTKLLAVVMESVSDTCSDCGTVLDDLYIGEEQETEYKYGRSQIKHIKTGTETINCKRIEKVFKYFDIPNDAYNEAIGFYSKYKSKLNAWKGIEIGLVLATLIGSDSRPGWLLSDYLKAFPEPVDLKHIRSIYLTLFPSFTRFQKISDVQLQVNFVVEKLYPTVVQQLQQKFKKLYKKPIKSQLIKIARQLTEFAKNHGIGESAHIRPVICAAIFISALYLQRKECKKKSALSSPLYVYKMQTIEPIIEISHRILADRYNDILKLLGTCLEKVPWLSSVNPKNAVYFLDDILTFFHGPDPIFNASNYQSQTIRKAERKREEFTETIREAKQKFDQGIEPNSKTSLEFHMWNLLSRGYSVEELETWHPQALCDKSNSFLFKERFGIVNFPRDIDSVDVTQDDMSDQEVALYLTESLLAPI
ncbi:hypothetical protein G6F36_002607 [Rhizopus arrhizus]|nr:hypothetical protein G6F36_002607 [Rhizopus arrhizus]